MKTLTLMLTALVMSVTVTANTNTPFPASKAKVAFVQSENLMKMYFESPDESKIKIVIYNEKGDQIGTKKVGKTSGFILPFNFENMDYGMYTFEISDENGTLVESVNYQPKLKKGVKASLYKINNIDKVRLSVLVGEDSPATIEIYDKDSRLIHKESAKEAFTRVYDLSKIKGDVYFTISDGDNVIHCPVQK